MRRGVGSGRIGGKARERDPSAKASRVSREREGAGGLFDGPTRDRLAAGAGWSFRLRDLIQELEGHWDGKYLDWDCGERAC